MRRLALALLALAGCVHGGASSLSPRDEARVHLQKNEPEQAIPLLDTLSAEAPADLELARLRVEAYVKAGRTDALIARLAPAAARGDSPVTFYMLGLARFARAEDVEPAIKDFERAIALRPKEAEFHYRLGIALLESERYDQALPSLRRAQELAPDREGYSLPLAKALYRTGDRAGAVAALGRVLAQHPSPQEVATARALMEKIGDPFAAVPQAARPKLEQGIGLLHQDLRPQEAIVAFEEILADYPDLGVVHALLGLAYQRIDDAGRAVDEFKRAIELSPDDGKNYFYLGSLYLSHQKPEPARDAFEKALTLNPLLDDAYFQLGDLALGQRDLPRARDAFARLVLLEPDSIPARGKLAAVMELQKDWAGADHQLRAVLEKDPDNVEFKLRLGLLNTERARGSTQAGERASARAEAQKWLAEVLEAQPDNATASQALQLLKAQ